MKQANNKYQIFILFFALCAVYISGIPTASAQTAFAAATGTMTASTTESNVPACHLTQALDELLAVNDSDIDAKTKKENELEARINVLSQTVICAKAEIDDLQNRLSNLNLEADEDTAMNEALLNALTSATEYYNAVESKMSDAMTLDEVRTLADAVLAWRNTYYLPLLNQVNNFNLVMSGVNSLDTAKNRLQKITNVLTLLRLDQVVKIKALLNGSKTLTNKAANLNSKAHSMVLDYVIASTTTEIFPASSTTESTTNEVSVGTAASSSKDTLTKSESPVTVASLIKESLNNIKSAYTNYLGISDLVKKILGL